MVETKFDYIVIGAGSAGFAAVIAANELGIKTALVNGGLPLGGTCVNVGCVPSKTLLHIAETYHQAVSKTIPGILFEKVTVNFQEAVEHELMLVEQMRQMKYQKVLAALKKVTFFDGQAKFTGTHEIIVGEKRLWGEKLLICAGSTSVAPQIPGLDKVDYLTNVEALKLKQLPERLIVIGGGAVALEFAQMFCHFGSRVAVLQRSQLIKEAEPEISRGLVQMFADEGVKVYENLEFIEVKEQKGQKVVVVRLENGEKKELSGDKLLVGTGRRANTAELGLEAVGVATEKDRIKVDRTMRTSVDNIWSAGDIVAAPKRLETTAAKEGNIATQNAWTDAEKTITYEHIPAVIFTTPAVASVGLTDQEAAKRGIECNCTTIPFEMVPKAKIIGDTRGLIKMVINNKSKKILGAHILSKSAEEMIHEATLAVKFNLTVDDIRDTVHVFPTLSEAIKLAAQSFNKDLGKLSCCIE